MGLEEDVNAVKNGLLLTTAKLQGEQWLPPISLFLFLVSTVAVGVRLTLLRDLSLDALFLPGLVFIQGYVIWFYFTKFQQGRRTLLLECPENAHTYSWLFVIAMVGTSIVAMVGFYVFECL